LTLYKCICIHELDWLLTYYYATNLPGILQSSYYYTSIKLFPFCIIVKLRFESKTNIVEDMYFFKNYV